MEQQAAVVEITQEELIQSIIDNLDGCSKRFAFLLGAGASVSSGIPAAAELAEQWLKDLKKNNQSAYEEINGKTGTSNTDFAAAYSAIYQARFRASIGDGYHEIEKRITNSSVVPSLGYIVLANFLWKTDNKIIITTNFDRLPETALLTLFSQHAKVIYHPDMLQLISLNQKTPTIIKIHHDGLFQPQSANIATLNEAWHRIINEILTGYQLIIVGYGGNDQEGLMEYLLEKAQADQVYWCYRGQDKVPQGVLDVKWKRVRIAGFDEFMLALSKSLPADQIPRLESILQHIKQTAEAQVNRLDAEIKKFSGTASDSELLQKFVADTWWEVQLAVKKETDSKKQDELYQEGLKKFPNSFELMNNYANFLKNIRQDYDQAERLYKKALQIDPDDANNNDNYANFLLEHGREQEAIPYKKKS